MHRPASGPLWPPTDDPVENSLRRVYLRAPPRQSADPVLPDRFQELLGNLTEALQRPERRQAFRQTA